QGGRLVIVLVPIAPLEQALLLDEDLVPDREVRGQVAAIGDDPTDRGGGPPGRVSRRRQREADGRERHGRGSSRRRPWRSRRCSERSRRERERRRGHARGGAGRPVGTWTRRRRAAVAACPAAGCRGPAAGGR